jgi:hypothetical protein
MKKHLSRLACTAALLATALLTTSQALASPVYFGSVTGQWTAPVLAGSLLNPADLANPTFSDNTETALCNLSPCAFSPPNYVNDESTSLVWGYGDFAVPNSKVTFVGESFSGVLPNLVEIGQEGTTFRLGTLTYTNGTSGLLTLIFGGTLTLSVTLDNDESVVVPFSIDLNIRTTNNEGTEEQNADFLDFSTQLGTVAPVSFNVLEGETATAIVWGRIVGDPFLFATGLTLDPNSVGKGFVGTGLPDDPVPAPLPIALLGLGLIAMVGASRKSRLRKL